MGHPPFVAPAVASYFQQGLGRPLSASEAEVLAHLSAQGMAKVNADLCRGLPPEVTMASLRVAYEQLQTYCHTLTSALLLRPSSPSPLPSAGAVAAGGAAAAAPPPVPLLPAIEAVVGRGLSGQELQYLGRIPPISHTEVLHSLRRAQGKGKSPSATLAHVAHEFTLQRLSSHAQALSSLTGLAVECSTLAPTTDPLWGNVKAKEASKEDAEEESAPIELSIAYRGQTPVLSLGPALVWFVVAEGQPTAEPLAEPTMQPISPKVTVPPVSKASEGFPLLASSFSPFQVLLGSGCAVIAKAFQLLPMTAWVSTTVYPAAAKKGVRFAPIEELAQCRNH